MAALASSTPSSACELLRELREQKFDALVGVNLLREGLDLPEVSLVAILDADKEGFLRSETSLMQTIGRSARNVNAKVMLYADKVTEIDAAGHRRNGPPPRSCSWNTTASTASRRKRSARRSAAASKRSGKPSRSCRIRPESDRTINTSPRNISTSWSRRCWQPPKISISSGPPSFATGFWS